MRRWTKLTLPHPAGFNRFGPLSHLRPGMCSYLTHPDHLREIEHIGGKAYIFVEEGLAQEVVARGHSPIVSPHPEGRFWKVFLESVRAGAFEDSLPSTVTSPIPRVRIDVRATVAATAVVGGPPFKVISPVDECAQIAPAVGGVSVGAGASIGSCTCIDSGIFGEWTEIDDFVFIDNLVHVAHGVRIRELAKVVAGSVIGGWCDIGERAWIGINASIKQHVKIGECAVIGAGAVVLRDVPAGETWVGNPARKLR